MFALFLFEFLNCNISASYTVSSHFIHTHFTINAIDFTRLKLVKKLNEAMEKQQKKEKELEVEKQMKSLTLKDKDITAAFDVNDDDDVVF